MRGGLRLSEIISDSVHSTLWSTWAGADACRVVESMEAQQPMQFLGRATSRVKVEFCMITVAVTANALHCSVSQRCALRGGG